MKPEDDDFGGKSFRAHCKKNSFLVYFTHSSYSKNSGKKKKKLTKLKRF